MGRMNRAAAADSREALGVGEGTAEWTSVPSPSALPAQVVGPASAWAEVALTPGVL